MCRAELGNRTTGDRHSERLARLDPTEHLTDLIAQLLLCYVAHDTVVAELLPRCLVQASNWAALRPSITCTAQGLGYDRFRCPSLFVTSQVSNGMVQSVSSSSLLRATMLRRT